MPSYPFECPVCKNYQEVYRPVRDCAVPEMCGKCDTLMRRVYTVPQVKEPFREHYNHGLGCYLSTRHDKRDAIRRIADGGKKQIVERDPKTGIVNKKMVDVPGREIVEVGTESPKVKPKRVSYDLPRGVFDR